MRILKNIKNRLSKSNNSDTVIIPESDTDFIVPFNYFETEMEYTEFETVS